MIPELNPYNNWSGNGSTTTFDFDFYIEDESQLAVYHTNSENVQTTLTYGTDYSINEVGNENGSYITFPLSTSSYDVLGDDEVISLCLTLPISQENEYGRSSYLNLETVEYSYDYLTRICQILNRQLERCVKVNEGSSSTADELIEALQEAQVNAASSASAAASSAADSASEAADASNTLAEVKAVAEEATATVAAINDLLTSKIGQPEITLNSVLQDNEIWLEGAEVAIDSYPLLYEIYGDTYGEAEEDGYFVLPDFRDRAIWGAEDFGYLDAGLPDIYGQFAIIGNGNHSAYMSITNHSGAFSNDPTYYSRDAFVCGDNYNSNGGDMIYFNASDSDETYGASDTVQPPAIKVRVKTRYE